MRETQNIGNIFTRFGANYYKLHKILWKRTCNFCNNMLIFSQHLRKVQGNFLKYTPREGITIELDEYLRVISAVRSSDVRADSQRREIFGKSQQKESSIDFGNIFRTACDELKQNRATHTKTRVMTLTWQSSHNCRNVDLTKIYGERTAEDAVLFHFARNRGNS